MIWISRIAGLLAAATGVAFYGVATAGTLADCNAASRVGDGAAAIRCLEPLAKAGDPKAESMLGVQYGVINEPTYDAQKSAFWTRKAAEDGDLSAQVMAGYMYRRGDGVPKDLSEALKWFRTAAERGDQHAEDELARMYFKGWGTPRDMGQAIVWERKAADQGGSGATMAELSLGEIYRRGLGVPEDDAEAVRWFRRAAEQGSPIAYLYLAEMDENGLGGPADPLGAYEGYSIALTWLQNQHSPENVTSPIAQRRDTVAAKLSSAQKADADRFVREHQGEVR